MIWVDARIDTGARQFARPQFYATSGGKAACMHLDMPQPIICVRQFGQTPAVVARLHNRSQALAWLGETEDLILQLRHSKKKERTLVKQVESCEEELSKAVDEFESQKREWQQQRDQFRRMILELQQELEMNIREPKRLKQKIRELGCASEALIKSHESQTKDLRKRIKIYRGY